MQSYSAFAKFDMAIHSPNSHEECLALDEVAIFHDLRDKLTLCPHPNPGDRGHPHTTISHLVSGYDVGYYSYNWYISMTISKICTLCTTYSSAQVFADDIFHSIFARNPYDKAAWVRYRRGILEYGGSRNELDILEELLGRPVDPSASLLTLEMRL